MKTQMKTLVFERIENIVGKEENVGYQHFLLFLQCFHKTFLKGSLKPGVVWLRVLILLQTGSVTS